MVERLRHTLAVMVERKQWREALWVAMKLIDDHNIHAPELDVILIHVHPDANSLLQMDTGASLCVLGAMYTNGSGKVPIDLEMAQMLFLRSAQKSGCQRAVLFAREVRSRSQL